MKRRFKALVLAGSRRAERDPVARAAGVPHKALAPVAGRPMIAHVLEALLDSGAFEALYLVLDDALRQELPAWDGFPARLPLTLESSRDSIAASVAQVFARTGPPLFVTTADHPLLTADILREFLDRAERAGGDVTIGLVEAGRFAPLHEPGRRTWLRFAKRRFSGANLFLLRSSQAQKALEFWRRVERERKRPWRLAAAFGPGLLFGYLLHRWTLEGAFARMSRRLGVELQPVVLSRAEAAIDVDRPEDLRLVERLLARRPGVAG